MKGMGKYYFLIVLCLCLSGCASSSKPPSVQLETVSLVVDEDANEVSATSVHLLVVYNQELLERLQGIKAYDYFRASDQFARDYPEMMDVWRWELVPGQVVDKSSLPSKKNAGALGAIVFADYLNPGDHRARVGFEKALLIRLSRYEFWTEPLK